MARPKNLPEEMISRFPAGTFDRMRAVLEQDEDGTSFVRTAGEHELKRRLFEPTRPRHEKQTAETWRIWDSLFPDQEASAVEALKLWKSLTPEIRSAIMNALAGLASVRRRLADRKQVRIPVAVEGITNLHAFQTTSEGRKNQVQIRGTI